MNFSIPPDLRQEMEFIVKDEYSAAHLGSGTLKVLSTPSMILFMERAARIALDEVLDEGLSSVGIAVNIHHRKAVNVGNSVVAKANVETIDGKKIIFRVEVLHGEDVVGDGTHTRYVINQSEFMERLNALQS